MTAFRHVGLHGSTGGKEQQVQAFAELARFFKSSEVARLEFWMTRRKPVCAAVLNDFPLWQCSDKGGRQHSFGPIAHCSIGEEFGAGVGRDGWFARRWLTLATKSQVPFHNPFCAKVLNDTLQRVFQSCKV